MYFNIKLSGCVYERECYFEIERERERESESVCMYFNIKLSEFVYERGCYFERERECSGYGCRYVGIKDNV